MKSTSLADLHVELGAKMIEFGGWNMPVQYGPILDEVRAVRQRAGLFDLGHMGRLDVRGPDAVPFLDRIATNCVARIPVGSIRYSLICRPDGNPIDDVLVYRGEDSVYVVVNASNRDAVLAWMEEHRSGFDVEIDDQTERTAMLALQGEASQVTLQAVVPDRDLGEIGYYKFGFATVSGMEGTRISRTGYTGEDGFEVYFPTEHGPRVFRELLAAGQGHGVLPIGLGARDVLRLEAGMPLYGHEIDLEHNPIEAGLKFGVSFREEKEGTIGFEALRRVHESPSRRLVGLTTDGPRVPRQGTPLFDGDERVGEVCSGAPSPTLETKIASAYVRLGRDEAGTELSLDFRGKRQPCVLRDLPFYSRTRK